MTLRAKTVLATAVAIAVVAAAFFLVSEKLTLRQFDRLEARDVSDHVGRHIPLVLGRELDSMDGTAMDWAYWDETWRFLGGENPHFVRDNFSSDTLAPLRLDLMLFLDREGREVLARGRRGRTPPKVALPPAIRERLERDPGSGARGILRGAGGAPLLVVARPVLTGRETGPVRGTLVLARALDPDSMQFLSSLDRMELSFLPFAATELDPAVRERLLRVGGEAAVEVRDAGDGRVEALTVLRDWEGAPSLLLRGEKDREIYRQGAAASRVHFLLLLGALLGTALITGFAFERMVVARLVRMREEMKAIEGRGDATCLTAREEGGDEICSLGRSINRLLHAVRGSKGIFEVLVAASPIPIVVVGEDRRVREWNRAAAEAFGLPPGEALGEIPSDLPPGDVRELLRDLVERAGPLIPHRARVERPQGEAVEIQVYPSRLPGVEGQPGSLLVMLVDVTPLKRRDDDLVKALAEKELLLKEVHHRVKNNLQAISGILDLQKAYLRNPVLASELEDSQNRIRAMALIHEELYQSKDLILIDLSRYLRQLAEHLFITYGAERKGIALSLDLADTRINIETAIPFGLIVNEVVSNSIKHAFPGRTGTIRVALEVVDEAYHLVVSDDGVGIPEEHRSGRPGSLGMLLIRSLSEQLHGRLQIQSSPQGTTFDLICRQYEECRTSQL